MSPPDSQQELVRRIHLDIIDDFDEELEMETEDHEYDASGALIRGPRDERRRSERQLYFRELFRLQGETASPTC